jgi:hypothetical protein
LVGDHGGARGGGIDAGRGDLLAIGIAESGIEGVGLLAVRSRTIKHIYRKIRKNRRLARIILMERERGFLRFLT